MELTPGKIKKTGMRSVLSLATLAFYLVFDLLFFPSQIYAENASVRVGNQTITPQASVKAMEIVLPPELGVIDESYLGGKDKTIVYIQDAHDSLEAQENISSIIHYIVDEYGVQTVFEEAY